MQFIRAIVGQSTYNLSSRAHEATVTIETSAGRHAFKARAYLPILASQKEVHEEYLRLARCRFEAKRHAPVIEVTWFRS